MFDSCFLFIILFLFTHLFQFIVDLSQAPDPITVVYDLLRDRAYQWNDIGRELRVSYGYREGLKREGVQSTDETKLDSVIFKWEQSQCSDVTWSNVIKVLKILQFNDLMEPIKNMLRHLSGNNTKV